DLCKLCVPAVIQAVVTQLRQDLEDPGRDSSRCQLRVLDMTGLPYDWIVWDGIVALSKACVEVSKHQQEFQRCGSKPHKGCSRAATA
ncbi:LRC14 protein, partial [Erpornis zantholeuca]|nr:LRC14 protein [Erpornis zantholeuca]